MNVFRICFEIELTGLVVGLDVESGGDGKPKLEEPVTAIT